MTELADAKHREVLAERFLPQVDGRPPGGKTQSGSKCFGPGLRPGHGRGGYGQGFSPKPLHTGLDIDPDSIEAARELARREGADNVEFVVGDAAAIKDDPKLANAFDYVTAFDAVHDQSRPAETLAGAYHVLAPGGVFSMIDIACRSDHAGNLDHPMGPFLYAVSLMHCMPVGLNDGGAGLGMMWGREKAVQMLEEAGFQEIEVLEMADDPFNLHFQCKKMTRDAGLYD